MNPALANAVQVQPSHFDVSLINRRRAKLMKIDYAFFGAVLSLLGAALVDEMHLNSKLVIIFGLVPAVLAIIFYFLRVEKDTTELSGIMLSANKLRVFKYKADKELTIFLTEIASYKFDVSQDVYSLQLWLRDGYYVAFATEGGYKGAGDFIDMCQSVMEFAKAPQLSTKQPYVDTLPQGISRRKDFFEKPLSTYLFLVLILATAALIYCCAADGSPVANLWPLLIAPLSYGLPWYINRDARAA